MAAIGQRAGVADVLGVKFSGFPAWWLWRTIYLSKLPGWDRKVRVALQWTLDVIFSKDVTQYLTVRAPTMSQDETIAVETHLRNQQVAGSIPAGGSRKS
jgi:NADH dehydrogenase